MSNATQFDDVLRGGTLDELRRRMLPGGRAASKALFLELGQVGLSVLLRACQFGRLDMAEALVKEHGHPVDLRHPGHGCTAFLFMCGAVSHQGVALNLRAAVFLVRTLGANPLATTTEGNGALHFAAREGHTELARILVREFRLDPNALNKAGQSPLFKARCDARVMLSLLPVTTGRMWHLFAS